MDLDERVAALVDQVIHSGVHLTGGEAVAVLLAAAGVQHVFAYGGTSELPLCDAVENIPGINLINGRGDRESAFMAAGSSLLRPNTGAAILHGARGLTNAAGALADARRNEAGTVFVVGLPSTGSSRFLPPHGENDLIATLGAFARWSWESPAVPDGESARRAAADEYVERMREAIITAGRQPWGPVLFGVPQDVTEARWVPLAALVGDRMPAEPDAPVADDVVADLIFAAQRPVVLIDDYALRSPGIRAALDRFSRLSGAVVTQVRYRRGLMLFERLHTSEVAHFIGWLNQYSAEHRGMLSDCDLLITVEDRNLYRRVVGELPACRKVAINSDPRKVLKNEYLRDEDVLVEGDPTAALEAFSDRIVAARGETPAPLSWSLPKLRGESRINPEPPAEIVNEARRQIVGAISGVLSGWSRPVVVDDSSMFGGLITEHYDDLPLGLRVFGGHGGFVGAGLGYAVGAAIGEPAARVLCILGDQAFTNSYQALIAAVRQRARLVIVVCNNGESVSLKKQGAASYGDVGRRYLDNDESFRYVEVARAHGVPAERVAVPVGESLETVGAAVAEFAAALERAAATDGPALVEIVLPADPSAWQGIWVVHGFEQAAPVSVG
uniref:Putative acetolactate synthase large subunit n=1 Tax=Amycolatopsis sp. SANK 60206 TaxID=1642649 RepID=A0A0E3USD1_9PSEU|nr:putative acetolactate synthase large subunit [Amycolatopsis sp. SANK 60206]